MTGVMGYPIEHSRSPIIHNHWIKQYKLSGTYGLFPVNPKNLEKAIQGISALGLAGCNVTIPHKVEATRYMDWLDPFAKKVGAINTIVVQPSGEMQGFNHDGYGYLSSIKESLPDWSASHGPIVVIGAGGASRAILVALLDAGAQEIRLINRTTEKARELANEFGPEICPVIWQDRHNALAGSTLVVNTTNQGMHNQPELDIHLDELPQNALVSDIIYTPLQTKFLKDASNRGNTSINGLGMLLHQARPAFESWFGVMPNVTAELKDKLLKSL